MSALRAPELLLRPYERDDEAAVISVLEASLGGGPGGRRPPEFFRWKHLENPFGDSYMLLAESDGEIVGVRAFMRWTFELDGRQIPAVRAVDTATRPDFQGRGIFSKLTKAALADLATESDLVFNTPNEKSMPGYLKMGWVTVGQVPISLRVRHPFSFLRNARSLDQGGTPSRPAPRIDAAPASEVLGRPGLGDLLDGAETFPGRISTVRSPDYLRWRYGRAPLLDYRAVAEIRDGSLRGLAIFRVRHRAALWETTVAELIFPDGDVRTAGRLLRKVVAAADTDHVTAHLPAGGIGARAARRRAFLPAPGGLTLVVNPLRDLPVDVTSLEPWAFALGDLEVF